MSYYSIAHGRSLELGSKGVLRVHLDQEVRWWPSFCLTEFVLALAFYLKLVARE